MKKTFVILLTCVLLVFVSCSVENGLEEKMISTSNIITSTRVQKSTISFTHTSTVSSSVTPISNRRHTVTPAITSSPHLSYTPTVEISERAMETSQPHIVPARYQTYIGAILPPMPSCCVLEGSGLIEGQTRLAFSFVSDQRTRMIWITQMIGGGDEKVLEIFVLPELNGTENVSMNYCQYNGKMDPYIIAISRLDRDSINTRYISNEKIQKAWRIDPIEGIITSLPTEGIDCNAEGGWDPNNVIYQFLKAVNYP